MGARRVTLEWRKSRRSGGGQGGDCVEVAGTGEEIAVRDSKDPVGSNLRFTQPEWDAFLEAAKRGRYDR